jgi:hypothetical protein
MLIKSGFFARNPFVYGLFEVTFPQENAKNSSIVVGFEGL